MSKADDTATPPAPPADENVDYGNHRRNGWCALLCCSIVALAAKVSDTWGHDEAREWDDWFVIVVSAVSIGCSFLAIMGYAISTEKLPGSAFEGFFSILCLIIWICGMPILMDANRDMAVSKGWSRAVGNVTVAAIGDTQIPAEFTYIRNANIYFFR